MKIGASNNAGHLPRVGTPVASVWVKVQQIRARLASVCQRPASPLRLVRPLQLPQGGLHITKSRLERPLHEEGSEKRDEQPEDDGKREQVQPADPGHRTEGSAGCPNKGTLGNGYFPPSRAAQPVL